MRVDTALILFWEANKMTTYTDPEPGEVEKYLQSKGLSYRKQGQGEELLFEACPFCGKKEKYYINQRTGQYHCKMSGCIANEKSGNLITLKKHFGDLVPLPMPRRDDQKIQRVWRAAVEFWKSQLFRNEKALKYWLNRGIQKDTLEKHNIGFWNSGLLAFLRAKDFSEKLLVQSGLIREKDEQYFEKFPDNYTIPVYENGVIVSVKFRVPPWREGKSKIFVLPGTGTHIYNMDNIKGDVNEIILCEGEPDTWTLDQVGIPAVGIPGAGTFKEEWGKCLERFDTVLVALDPDKAGEKGFSRISRILGRKIFKINMPNGMDINDFFITFESREEAKEHFQKLIDHSTCYTGGVLEEQDINNLIPENGLIKEYVNYASILTDAPKRFHLMGAFQIISALLRNKVRIEFGAYTLKPNIYAICLAKSSQFRKSTALNIVKNIIKHFETNEPKENEKEVNIILPNEFSRESLYPILQKNASGTFFINEVKGFLSMLCRSYNEGLKEFFTDIYDGGNIKRVLKSHSYFIKDPCVSIFAASTIDWFVQALTGDDLAGGFLYRFLYLPARVQPKYIPCPPEKNLENEKKILETANSINSLPPGFISLQGETKQHYEKWACKFHRKRVEKDFEPFIERYTQYALKLTILYELQSGEADYNEETKTYNLSLESLKYGIAATEFFFSETQRLFSEEISFSKLERMQLHIKKILREAGGKGLSKSDIYRKTRSMTKREREEAIEHLQQTNEITIEKVQGGRGRNEDRYFLVK